MLRHLLILFLLLSTVSASSGGIYATGFSKIKPQLAGVGFNVNGTFTGVFTNGVGKNITINFASFKFEREDISEACRKDLDLTVESGENFLITLDECTSTGIESQNVEQSLNHEVTIEYSENETKFIETGRLNYFAPKPPGIFDYFFGLVQLFAFIIILPIIPLISSPALLAAALTLYIGLFIITMKRGTQKSKVWLLRLTIAYIILLALVLLLNSQTCLFCM